MKKTDEITRLLSGRLREAASGTFDAEIVEVDEQERTCKVLVGNIEYEDVALYAINDEDLRGFCFIPKIESRVLVSRIGGSNMLYVSMFSEIEKVILTIEDDKGLTTLSITADGFAVKRNSSGLKKTLSDLCDAILRLTVPTATGPSGTPINALQFAAIKQELNQYLNDN